MTEPAGPPVAVIGAGPAGLLAADVLAEAGCRVTLYERMASPARKFLLAGRGGLNLTHSEPRDAFLACYGEAAAWLAPVLDAFPPARLRRFVEGLGEPTFVGSSGRVFPQSFKASPLLRAWLGRLGRLGVELAARHVWQGWTEAGDLLFAAPQGRVSVNPAATLLALGGASWLRLGSDGSWVPLLRAGGVDIADLKPANAGLRIVWSDPFRARFSGTPLKRIAMSHDGRRVLGEAVVTQTGLEGGAAYLLFAGLRESVRTGPSPITIDLRPDLDEAALAVRLAVRRNGESQANRLRKAGLAPAAAGLLREAGTPLPADSAALARRIKHVELAVIGVSGIDRAISSAGGVCREAFDTNFMLRARPGTFVAGEMLDWEAPTGGYLLQASFATGHAAACGVLRRLDLPFPPNGPEEW